MTNTYTYKMIHEITKRLLIIFRKEKEQTIDDNR